MATPAKQEFSLKDLVTTHVIFYPSRAHITRNISNVELQPGPNQIEIYGITPTADENSVKVDGTGASASITDMTIDLVPNKVSFEDVYPADEFPELDDDHLGFADLDIDDALENHEKSYPTKGKDLDAEIESLEEDFKRSTAIIQAADNSTEYLNKYCQSMDAEHLDASGVKSVLDLLHQQRLSDHDASRKAHQQHEELRKTIASKKRERDHIIKDWSIERARKKRQADKEKAKRSQQRSEKRREAARIRQQRLDFWPKKVYRVVVHIDLPTETPGSSRRSSVSSLTTLVKEPEKVQSATSNGSPKAEAPTGTRSVSLVVSYVTSDASWSPRYDISFSTPSKSGSIVYRAEFRNATSETWKDTKVSLSTSQASFRGLGDEVPFMKPWPIGLIKTTSSSALMNKQEIEFKHKIFFAQPTSTLNRAQLFGSSSSENQRYSASHRLHVPMAAPSAAAAPGAAATPGAAAAFGAAPPPQATFGQSRSLRRAASPEIEMMKETSGPGQESDEDMGFGLFAHEPTQMPQKSSLEDEDTTWEDNGLTQTYELPSTRTLAPSFLNRRHKIASLPFTDLMLTSISVPKLRPAAFLRARFRNPSGSITLLGGTAGLTLDGTFLGNTSLPRVSPGELITLPLGVDPAIQVSYSKPVSKRSTQGIFNKEAAQIYTRNIFITNTKTVSADILVLDQIPVSTDEKLRVEVYHPRGLTHEGETVPAGVDAKQSKSKNWGHAKAAHKKNGEIRWDVTLEKGSACRLPLEYEIKLPANEGVQSL